MNTHTPPTTAESAGTPKAVRDVFFKLDDLLGRIRDAAQVFDGLMMMERADLAYLATDPIHELANEAHKDLISVWDLAMGKEPAQ